MAFSETLHVIIPTRKTRNLSVSDQKLYKVSTNVGESFVIPSNDLIIKEKLDLDTKPKPSSCNEKDIILNYQVNEIPRPSTTKEKTIVNFESYTISTNVLQSYVIPAKDLLTKNKIDQTLMNPLQPRSRRSKFLKSNHFVEESSSNKKVKKLKSKRKFEQKSKYTSSSDTSEDDLLLPKKSKDIDLLLENVEEFEKQFVSDDFKALPVREQKMKLKQQEAHIKNLLKVLNSLRSSMNNITRANRKKEEQITKLKTLLSELGMEIVEEDTLVLGK